MICRDGAADLHNRCDIAARPPEIFTPIRACRNVDTVAIRSLPRSHWLLPQRTYSQAKAIL
jgi:hypothetical protein